MNHEPYDAQRNAMRSAYMLGCIHSAMQRHLGKELADQIMAEAEEKADRKAVEREAHDALR